MNIDRLNDLIRVMEGVRDAGRAFDIGVWAQLDARSAPETTLCNTACCAAGWCCFDPKFVENGFEMHATVSFDGEQATKEINISTKTGWMEMLEACAHTDYDGDVMIAPYYAGMGGFSATMEYFELTELQNSYLFDGSYYRDRGMYPHRCTPDDVIDHVQRVLDGRWVEDRLVKQVLADEADERGFDIDSE